LPSGLWQATYITSHNSFL